MINLLNNCQSIFSSGCVLNSFWHSIRIPIFSCFCQHVLAVFFIIAILEGVKWYLMVLICIFLSANDIGIGRELGVDMYTLQCLKWVTSRTCCTAQGTLLQVVWRPGWGRSLQENGYLYVCGRNYRSMVNQLYSNTKWRVKKKWIGNPQIGRKICDTRTQQRNLYPEYTRIYYNLGIISSKSLLKNAQRFPTIW